MNEVVLTQNMGLALFVLFAVSALTSFFVTLGVFLDAYMENRAVKLVVNSLGTVGYIYLAVSIGSRLW